MATDEVDDILIQSNKDKITDLLEKRNRERIINLDSKHEQSKKNAADGEDHEYFLNTFKDHVKQIEDGVADLQAGDSSKLNNQISQLQGNIQNLQNYLTSSTLFLSNYTIKACQATINDLKSSLDASKARLVVKKKFGFRSKVEPAPAAALTAQKEEPPTKKKVTVPSHINWTVQNRTGEEITLTGEAVHHQDITMSNMVNCIIRIVGYPGSLQFSRFTNCIVVSGPVSRSVFADNCSGTKLSFGCQQLRLHSSTRMDIYMHVTSRAIIEDCTEIRVAPNMLRYEGIDADFVEAGLDAEKNNWDNVADFNWLSTDVQSPNWSIMDGSHRIADWEECLKQFRQQFAVAFQSNN